MLTPQDAAAEMQETLAARYVGQPLSQNEQQIERDKLYLLKAAGYAERLPMFDVRCETSGKIIRDVRVTAWDREAVLEKLQWVKSNEGSLSGVEARNAIMSALLGLIGDKEINHQYELVSRYFFEHGGRPRTVVEENAYEVVSVAGGSLFVVAESVAEASAKVAERCQLKSVRQVSDRSNFIASSPGNLYRVCYEEQWVYYCLAASVQEAIGAINSKTFGIQNRSIKSLEVLAFREQVIL